MLRALLLQQLLRVAHMAVQEHAHAQAQVAQQPLVQAGDLGHAGVGEAAPAADVLQLLNKGQLLQCDPVGIKYGSVRIDSHKIVLIFYISQLFHPLFQNKMLLYRNLTFL